nr:TetR/AcrR family transcriptional regulator [Sphingomonas sp. CDS-1]
MVMKDEVWEFKRERILDEAVPLFAEFGFQGVSIDKIAKQLKVTKPFIYTYFKNKDALLEEIFERAAENLLTGANAAFASDTPPEERLKAFVKYYVIENIQRTDITAIFLNEEKNLSEESQKRLRARHHEFDKRLAQLIEDGIKSGVFAAEDPMLASLAISGMVRWIHRWYRPDGRLSAEQVAAKMTDFALSVVSYTPKAKRKPVRKVA